MDKHAYLLVANSNFSVLRACLRLIDDSRNDIYLLLDKKANASEEVIEDLRNCLKLSNILFLEGITVNWGGYSQINAVMRLLEEAASKQKYSYYHFLQGSDLPIKTQDAIHRFFDSYGGVQFICVEKKRTSMAQSKCWYRHFFCHNKYFRTSKLMKALNFSIVYTQKVLHIRHNTDIELYQGSALFSITQNFAEYLLSHEPEIRRRFRWSLAADECFIQTMAMNSCYKDSICDIGKENSCNARLIDRTRPDGKNSPHIWREDEFQYLINQPDRMCFARKFDELVDMNIIMLIEKHLLLHE